MEAAASVVGIVSFGLGLAKTLQAFIDSVIEAEETITLIVAEVNATASTLERLQDFIDQDKTGSQEQHRPTVFNNTAAKEIGACAAQCQKIYVQIIILIEKASMQNGEDGSKDIGSQGPAVDDPDGPAIRLADFSKNVTKLGRRMRWPWLEPRIKRCQEHLGRLKVSLMLSLQVFFIAESRARPSVARIFGTDEEGELRDKAEMLRKKMTELRAKKSSPKQSNRQPSGSVDGDRMVFDATSSTSNVSTTSGSSSRATESRGSASNTTSSLDYDGLSRSQILRALLVLRDFVTYIRNKKERKTVFKKDSASLLFEAYLIYPFPGRRSESNPPPLPFKLPFGHRRLTWEVKRALRKSNPWDILLILTPDHRGLVDSVVQQVQLAATGKSNVCLVAVDAVKDSDTEISDLEYGDLESARLVLFFRHELVHTRKKTTEVKTGAIEGRPRFTATVSNVFSGSQRRSKKRLELEERLRQEDEENTREEATNKADREIVEKSKAEIEQAMEALEAEKTRIEEERNAVESRHRALKDAEEAVMKGIEKSSARGELKKIFEAELAKKILEEEHAKVKASEEKAAAERAKPPIRFKDAVGRKFSFPFHLVQTWKGMEDLIRQAFAHVEVLGPHVQEGHYDMMDSQGQMILPSLWSAIIKPGDSVVMSMWPSTRPPQPTFSFPGRPMQGVPPPPGMRPEMHQRLSPAPWPVGIPPPPGAHHPRRQGRAAPSTYPLEWLQRPPPPPGFPARIATAPANKKISNWKPRRKGGKERNKHPKAKLVESRRDEASENIDEGEDVRDIDKELGLDDLDGGEKMAAKNVDELLETWTNVGADV